MQVSVLVKDGCDGEETPLLVLPFGSEAVIPQHLRRMHWRELATASTDDRLLRTRRFRVEAEIACRGYSMLAS